MRGQSLGPASSGAPGVDFALIFTLLAFPDEEVPAVQLLPSANSSSASATIRCHADISLVRTVMLGEGLSAPGRGHRLQAHGHPRPQRRGRSGRAPRLPLELLGQGDASDPVESGSGKDILATPVASSAGDRRRRPAALQVIRSDAATARVEVRIGRVEAGCDLPRSSRADRLRLSGRASCTALEPQAVTATVPRVAVSRRARRSGGAACRDRRRSQADIRRTRPAAIGRADPVRAELVARRTARWS